MVNIKQRRDTRPAGNGGDIRVSSRSTLRSDFDSHGSGLTNPLQPFSHRQMTGLHDAYFNPIQSIASSMACIGTLNIYTARFAGELPFLCNFTEVFLSKADVNNATDAQSL